MPPNVTRLSLCGTAPLKSYLGGDSTLLVSMSGQWDVSLQRCVRASPCFRAIRRLTRSSRSFGKSITIPVWRRCSWICSVLGTPDENTWPGVTSFPDFKSSFPKWNRDTTRALTTGLDETGLDLLERMLVYDPAGRLSAKQACIHPFFELGTGAHSGRSSRVNGYH